MDKRARIISNFIRDAFPPLPGGMEVYEVDGQIVFPILSGEGGTPNNDYILYLIKPGHRYYKYGISFRELFRGEIDRFLKYLEDENARKVLEFDRNGGNLGTGDNKNE